MAEFILLTAGILWFCYFGGLVLYVGLSSKFPVIWAVFGVCFTGAAILFRGGWIPVILKNGCLLTVGILALALFLGILRLQAAMSRQPKKNLDYLVVLGAQVKGTRPSLSLWYRIDRARAYLEQNPETKAVLSGGKGPDEGISEAQCMYEELRKMGISGARLILEEKSASTSENLEFTFELLKERHESHTKNLCLGMVTSNFHVFRSVAIARKKTDCHIYPIPAKSKGFLLPNYLLREFLGVVKDKMVGNL